MKKAFLITYAFTGDPSKYTGLYDAIKSFGGWWHYLDNTWLIMYDGTAAQILERLTPHINESLNLLVVEMGRDRQGWLPPKAWEWFKKNIPRNG